MSDKSGIRFGVRIHQGGYTYDDLRRVWIEADRLGYFSATLYDLLNTPTLECWTTLSALAAETHRIRLMPLTLANPYRHPAVLAKMAATLDVISGGRLELGIGAGGSRSDHVASGISFPSTRVRVEMLEESVQIIKMLWSGSKSTFDGKHYQITDALCDPAPVQKPRPPILIGGHGERYVLPAAAAHADMTNMRADMGIEEHKQKLNLLAQHCERVGRNVSEIELTHNANIYIAESYSALEQMLMVHASQMGMSLDDFQKTLGNAIVGTPEQCAEQIQRYVDFGITYFFLLFPHPIELDELRLFANGVMPSFD